MKNISLFFCAIIFFSSISAKENLVIPIEMKEYKPYIHLEINNKLISFFLDSGSRTSMHLKFEVARSIKGLRFTGKNVKSMDLAGRVYHDKEFIIPKLDANGMIFQNLKGVLFSPWGLSMGSSKFPEINTSVIGTDFFLARKY